MINPFKIFLHALKAALDFERAMLQLRSITPKGTKQDLMDVYALAQIAVALGYEPSDNVPEILAATKIEHVGKRYYDRY